MKKFISLLLAILTIVSVFSVFSVNAQENTTAEKLEPNKVYTSADGNYKYKLATYRTYGECLVESNYTSDTDIQIVKYIGKKAHLTKYFVPETIDGYTVGEIGEKAFKGKYIKHLIIHKNIRQICDRAFYGCEKLKMIRFKGKKRYGGISYIDKEAFAGCTSLISVNINEKSAVDIELREKAFYNCPNLKSIRLNEDAFVGKKALGYYYDKHTKKDKRVKNFKVNIYFEDGGFGNALSNLESYTHSNKLNCKGYFNDDANDTLYLEEGTSFRMFIDNVEVKSCKSSKEKVVRFTNGKLQCLKTGKANIEIKLWNGKKTYRKVEIGHSSYFDDSYPDIIVKDKYGNKYNYNNCKDSYKNLCARVKKGETAEFPIIGKVNEIDNVYKSSSKAKIVSSPSSSTLKIKGLARGTTTVKVKINGVKTINLKVKVL
ncbi:MAG: leucine-rich repeat domain-containing protein [Ruminococcus sp.]|nr:leucine-rich repeat domain-containing protein [Ruminococcus sp.]